MIIIERWRDQTDEIWSGCRRRRRRLTLARVFLPMAFVERERERKEEKTAGDVRGNE